LNLAKNQKKRAKKGLPKNGILSPKASKSWKNQKREKAK